MEFEFDPAKSASNKVKHGIDFVEAQRLWGDFGLVEVPTTSEDEPRFVAIGRIESRYWTAICTFRGEVVRIISVRRARKEEVRIHEGS